LRKKWREEILRKNPSLADKNFSLPIVSGGVTHALSLVGDMFLDRGDVVLLPDKFWENYDLLYSVKMQAELGLFPIFDADGGFNVAGLREALAARPENSKTMVVLNFPNNPTGYSITAAEADEIVAVLKEAADAGRNLIVVTDDAYFGLFYGDDLAQESLFARLANLHERILAVKVDGPTKEEFVWGFRTGMLTFGTRTATSGEALYKALEQKVTGAIRATVSNCSHAAQNILVKALSSDTIKAERKEKQNILRERALRCHEILTKPEYARYWKPYPFNAGYFMCVRLKGIDADTYRRHLLDKYGVGVISDGAHDIRVAFSAVDVGELEDLFAQMGAAAKDLLEGGGT
jgi:aspartate/methionine/tyrosine aminotransferase